MQERFWEETVEGTQRKSGHESSRPPRGSGTWLEKGASKKVLVGTSGGGGGERGEGPVGRWTQRVPSTKTGKKKYRRWRPKTLNNSIFWHFGHFLQPFFFLALCTKNGFGPDWPTLFRGFQNPPARGGLKSSWELLAWTVAGWNPLGWDPFRLDKTPDKETKCLGTGVLRISFCIC